MPKCVDEIADEIVDKLYSERELIFQNLQKVRRQIEKYDLLLKNLRKTDVSTDSKYQKPYKSFYRVRRKPEWCTTYFELLEREKKNTKIKFSAVIQELFNVTERVEASFSSKLVATVRPNLPVYDAEVCRQMRVKVPRPTMPKQDRINALIGEYERMTKITTAAVKKRNFAKLRDKFKESFPAYKFTDTKVFDLMMWQADRS